MPTAPLDRMGEGTLPNGFKMEPWITQIVMGLVQTLVRDMANMYHRMGELKQELAQQKEDVVNMQSWFMQDGPDDVSSHESQDKAL